MEERIAPAYITDNDTGVRYELDFSREAVKFAEMQGFDLNEIGSKSATCVENLFYYAFRMHHRNVSREKIDKLREKWGGVPEKLLTRLIQLYQQAQVVGTIQTDEEAEKNSKVTLEL